MALNAGSESSKCSKNIVRMSRLEAAIIHTDTDNDEENADIID